jgi:hypothetical protein
MGGGTVWVADWFGFGRLARASVSVSVRACVISFLPASDHDIQYSSTTMATIPGALYLNLKETIG